MKPIFLLAAVVLLAAALPARGAQGRLGGAPAGVSNHHMALGRRVYLRACAKCHQNGVAGAPRIGDRRAWSFRITEGRATLVRHAITGYMCNQGVLPPRGGDRSLTDAEIGAAIDYMLEKLRQAK